MPSPRRAQDEPEQPSGAAEGAAKLARDLAAAATPRLKGAAKKVIASSRVASTLSARLAYEAALKDKSEEELAQVRVGRTWDAWR